ncbi:MAG: DUF4876 domain-containing protein [Sodaliphilus pleomorphus]|uniref:DUF4876 domain-containing protein n=1 Tax=Sodaliphilus pleomorphus TaxID=2606626 RepID=UPI0024095F7D|nr:DUF4876 domain-containing protein [Sodaliphilus pleomorphus]MDD6473981.1 DUF4876 domain-containing protein [Sodaliphilus pleomorphus]
MKKMIYLLSMCMMLALTACNDDGNEPTSNSNITPQFEITLPSSLDSLGGKITNPSIEVKNVSTGRTSTFDSESSVSLPTGLYDITYKADVAVPGDTAMRHIVAFKQSVELTASNRTVKLTAYETVDNNDFIISEVFFTGTLQTSGNQYYGDDYIKIYNNTDHVLYADGLTLLESEFTTTIKYNYTPDIMDSAMTVQAIYTIPGSGHDHPVQPGGELLIVDTGIDHRVVNPNSFDLSKADFEWYDESSSPSHLDIDGPTVPNLDKWYCYTRSFWMLHNRGFKAWAIARIPVDKETYLKDYRYTYNYDIVVAAGTFPMSQTQYYVPNSWIVDAVNCSVASDYKWNVTAASLDRGWSYCGTIDRDKTRYFHSVRRKMLYLKDGHPVLKDTNNSTEDFNPYCIASEIERQHTSIDMNGTKSSTETWDGVTAK